MNIVTVCFYEGFINDLKNRIGVKTNTEIRLHGYEKKSNIYLKYIVKKNGKPNYKATIENLAEVEILFYRIKFGDHKSRVEFHFFNNSLFFYSFTFSHHNGNCKKELIQIINEKYLEGKPIDMNSNYIIDKNNNVIMLKDDVQTSIYYLMDEKIILDNIFPLIEMIKNKNKNRQKKNRKTLYQWL
jgi:hypothetical protein